MRAVKNPILYSICTLLALVSSFPIWCLVVGGAAWNGVNLVVIVYLLLSTGGLLGLLAGFPAAFIAKRVLAWVTVISATSIALVAAIFAWGFWVSRDRGVPFNSPFFFRGHSRARHRLLWSCDCAVSLRSRRLLAEGQAC